MPPDGGAGTLAGAMRIGVILAGAVAALALAPLAQASFIVDRNAGDVTLRVSGATAIVQYRTRGVLRHVTLSGAINARSTASGLPQVAFRAAYGYGPLRGGACRPYTGPPLPFLVAACTAPDGSYWALQSWQRLKPNYGGTEGTQELHLSHWTGPIAQLVVYQNWAFGGVRHLFGRLTYDGVGVYGFTATPQGAPRDGYGRNIYLDTFDSAYGNGWHRENSFLTHRGVRTPGDFCYGFFPHLGHPSGDGTRYRATAEGPGVTPDVMWTQEDIGPFNASINREKQALEQSWGDPKCQT